MTLNISEASKADLVPELPSYTRSLTMPLMFGASIVYALICADELLTNSKSTTPTLSILGAFMAAASLAGTLVLKISPGRAVDSIISVWVALAISHTLIVSHLLPEQWDISRLAMLILAASLIILSTRLMTAITFLTVLGILTLPPTSEGASDPIHKAILVTVVAAGFFIHLLRQSYLKKSQNQRKDAALMLEELREADRLLVKHAESILANLNTDDVLRHICQAVSTTAGVSRSAAVLWRGEDHLVSVAVSDGQTFGSQPLLQSLPLPSNWLKQELIAHEDEVLVPIDSDRFGTLMSPFSWPGGKYAHALALRQGDDIVGALILSGSDRNISLSAAHLKICTGLAYLASLALNNAFLLEALNDSNEVKNRFLMTASHELRTPLTCIIGFNAILREDPHLSDRQLRTLLKINTASYQLLHLIDQILEASRISFLRVPTDIVHFNIKDMLSKILVEEGSLIGSKHLKTTLVAPDDLSLDTDEAKLKGALRNIIHNACSFTPQGEIHIEAINRDSGVEITVKDAGIGIKAEHLARIFEPFRQVDESLTRSYPGLGLGLYLTKGLVKLLGGTISVTSRAQVGSTFHVWVPDRAVPAPLG